MTSPRTINTTHMRSDDFSHQAPHGADLKTLVDAIQARFRDLAVSDPAALHLTSSEVFDQEQRARAVVDSVIGASDAETAKRVREE
jgi:hypothetical protein